MAEGRDVGDVNDVDLDGRDLDDLDEGELDPPEPQQRPAPQQEQKQEEEEEDDDDLAPPGEDVASPRLVALAGALVFVAAVTASYLLMGWEIKEIREELAAKANTTYVEREIARLNSNKANWSDLDSARTMINDLTEVTNTLNKRVGAAEGEIKTTSGTASAANRKAKEASQVATDSRNRLNQLVHDNAAWLAGVDRRLDTLRTGLADSRREIDSRVGPVAVDLATFQAKQGAVNTVQDSVITLIRAKTGLTDERMKRLATAVKAKQKREAEKAAKVKEREERRKKK